MIHYHPQHKEEGAWARERTLQSQGSREANFDTCPLRNHRTIDEVKKERMKLFLKNLEINTRAKNFFIDNNMDFIPFVHERDGLGRLNKKSNFWLIKMYRECGSLFTLLDG